MLEIIHWLRGVEQLASEVYSQVANHFSEEPHLTKMFESLAEDEAWHFHVMGSAADFMGHNTVPDPAVAVDEQTSARIHGYLMDIRKELDQKGSIDTILLKMVELELSEWNDLFVYVVNVFKEQSKTFHYPAAKMQHHIKDIEYFLEVEAGKPHLLNKIKQVPRIWIENILVVDDDPLITEIIKALLSREGNIDIAHDGQEALDLLDSKFYKLIVSDIDMPVLDGFSFYEQAIKAFPQLENRFLFLSGFIDKERNRFLKKKGIPFFHKPVGIQHLRNAALNILKLDDPKA